MSEAGDDADAPVEPPHPRETAVFYGHYEAEQALLQAYREGRIPHAWLIGGPRGVGKATLAYRMVRFVLAHPDPKAPAVQVAQGLAVDPDHPVARRIAAQAHIDLLPLERTESETGKLRTVITVDQVRRTVGFFGSTAGEGGWRVCVIDAADELQLPNAANALLKVLEEPPARALLLLVSHFPGRLLPTIRSRCRTLIVRALKDEDVAKAAAAALSREASDSDLEQAAAAAGGSVARAIELLGGGALALRQRTLELLAKLPEIDHPALHRLGDRLGRAHEGAFEIVIDSMREWLSARLADRPHDPARLAKVAEVWEKLNRAARDVEVLNLERKPMIFAAFGLLAGTARG